MASVWWRDSPLMDAGVPLSAPVAGIRHGPGARRQGLRGADRHRGRGRLHHGDMDFKVAGTKDGITALQMDIKVPNVTHAIMTEALEQARQGLAAHLETR